MVIMHIKYQFLVIPESTLNTVHIKIRFNIDNTEIAIDDSKSVD